MFKLEKNLYNPKMIDLFWEGSLFRTVCKYLFEKELKALPEGLDESQFFTLFSQIESRTGKRYALSLLSKRAWLSVQLKGKLVERGIGSMVADQIVQYCSEKGYVDDQTLLRALIAQEIKKGRSQRAIHAKLTEKMGRNSPVLDSLFGRDFSSEKQSLDNWLSKHSKRLDLNDPTIRRKVIQKLFRQGFSADLIRSKIPF